MTTVLDAQAPPSTLEGRIIDAALDCVGRWGLSKTTLDDVARQAMCSRATLYRVYPGGKDALFQAVARSEVTRAGAAVAEAMAAADGIDDALARAVAAAAAQVTHHRALQFLLAHEPETVVRWLAFQRGEELLAFVASFAAPHLARWLPAAQARRVGEWAARIVLSFCFCPCPGVDLTDPDLARWVVVTFMLPGICPDR